MINNNPYNLNRNIVTLIITLFVLIFQPHVIYGQSDETNNDNLSSEITYRDMAYLQEMVVEFALSSLSGLYRSGKPVEVNNDYLGYQYSLSRMVDYNLHQYYIKNKDLALSKHDDRIRRCFGLLIEPGNEQNAKEYKSLYNEYKSFSKEEKIEELYVCDLLVYYQLRHGERDILEDILIYQLSLYDGMVQEKVNKAKRDIKVIEKNYRDKIYVDHYSHMTEKEKNDWLEDLVNRAWEDMIDIDLYFGHRNVLCNLKGYQIKYNLSNEELWGLFDSKGFSEETKRLFIKYFTAAKPDHVKHDVWYLTGDMFVQKRFPLDPSMHHPNTKEYVKQLILFMNTDAGKWKTPVIEGESKDK